MYRFSYFTDAFNLSASIDDRVNGSVPRFYNNEQLQTTVNRRDYIESNMLI